MNLFAIRWLELSFVLPLAGAACMTLFTDARRKSRWCLTFAGATLACTAIVSLAYYSGHPTAAALWNTSGRRVLNVDEINAPLLPLVALLFFLTALTTARTKFARFPCAGQLIRETVLLAAFACTLPGPLVALLAIDAFMPLLELRRRGQPLRLQVIHAAFFVLLMFAGWVVSSGMGFSRFGSLFYLAGIMVRTGVFPAHIGVTNMFVHTSFGTALLFATPLAGVYATARLVLPIAPAWALSLLGIVALATALYAACMGAVERDVRRYFAYLIVSHASLVLVGFGLHTPFAVTGALIMWASAALALTGLGLTLRSLESRFGSLKLDEFRGLYDQSPALAICFLMTGLATIGFPGTPGFVAVELLVDEAVGAHVAVGLFVVLTAAINGIGVVRAYLLLFTGRRHVTGVALGITPRESIAVWAMTALILFGGLMPYAYVESRHRSALNILRDRDTNLNTSVVTPEHQPH